jgi:osmotically-inducible protein OsmY
LQLADKLEMAAPPVVSTVKTLEGVERNQIHKILVETRWRIEGKSGAAAVLGLHPSTLRARMHKLGILRPEARVGRPIAKMTLLYHRSTSALNTSVKTKNGVVTLTGKAKNASEKDLATKYGP